MEDLNLHEDTHFCPTPNRDRFILIAASTMAEVEAVHSVIGGPPLQDAEAYLQRLFPGADRREMAAQMVPYRWHARETVRLYTLTDEDFDGDEKKPLINGLRLKLIPDKLYFLLDQFWFVNRGRVSELRCRTGAEEDVVRPQIAKIEQLLSQSVRNDNGLSGAHHSPATPLPGPDSHSTLTSARRTDSIKVALLAAGTSPVTGRYYQREAVAALADPESEFQKRLKNGAVFCEWGTPALGLDLAMNVQRVREIQEDRVCARLLTAEMEGDVLMGTIVPVGPFGSELKKLIDEGRHPTFGLRAFTHDSRREDGEVVIDHINVITFDFTDI